MARARPQTVIAVYRPKRGREAALKRLLPRHERALRNASLVTAQPFLVLKSPADRSVIEIFEWVSGTAADAAHQYAAVRAVWDEMARLAEFIPLGKVKGADEPFAHFERIQRPTTTLRKRQDRRAR